MIDVKPILTANTKPDVMFEIAGIKRYLKLQFRMREGLYKEQSHDLLDLILDDDLKMISSNVSKYNPEMRVFDEEILVRTENILS